MVRVQRDDRAFLDGARRQSRPRSARVGDEPYGPKRSARTVDNNYIAASKTSLRLGADHKRIARNPFATVKVTIPRAVKLREKSFRPDERRKILKAALRLRTPTPQTTRRGAGFLGSVRTLAPGRVKSLSYAAATLYKRGIPAIRITPEAGSVKGREARVVPLHEHLIEQGFLKFVAQHGAGPLFYNPDRTIQ